MEEIVNKVATSNLVVFDLEDYYQSGTRTQIDISQWLYEGFLLKEKDFRENLKNHDWSQYHNQYVAIYCSTDAILPAWATILVASYVANYAVAVVLGTLTDLETALYEKQLAEVNFAQYQDKSVILKGCSKKPVPETAYVIAIQNLQKFAKSIMYGEACSAVPIFKKNKF
jgi:Protein of unknown function (DUF2480)